MNRFPDPLQSRAVLIGASEFDESGDLPPLPSIRSNLADLRSALTNPDTGTITDEHCTVLSNPRSVAEVGNVLTRSAKAPDVLFVYYSGHGLVDERGKLHLALSSTNPDRLRWTALPFEMLREEIASSRASIRILVLDCCFSGRAVEAMSDNRSVIAGQIEIAGTYTMTSTTKNAPSTAPADERYTSFTGALLGALRGQHPRTLDDIYSEVHHKLSSLGLPLPQRRATNAAGALTLTKGGRRSKGPQIGHIPDVQPGQHFATRRDAHDARVHRPLQAGICGTKKNGAESIVLSGGYKDDQDHGNTIIYTGHGGQDSAANQVSDQSLDDSGNAALVTSYREGLPVRVLRGHQNPSVFSPERGYRYDGLYRICDYRSKTSVDGYLIWQFHLEAWEGTPTPPIRH